MESPEKKFKENTGKELRLPNGLPVPKVLPPEESNSMELPAKRKKPVIFRQEGNKKWVDNSLADWPEDDFRVYICNLSRFCNEDHIRKAFRKFRSLQKIKVVKDKFSGKSKGYGFLSFGVLEEYVKAMKEMDGCLVNNRPIQLKRCKK